MSAILTLGLLGGAAAGFVAGARPDLIARAFRQRRLGARRPGAYRLAAGRIGPGGPRPRNRTGAPPGDPDAAKAYVELLYPLAAAFFAGFVFSTLVPEALTHSRGTLIAFGAGIAGMGLLSRFVFKADPCCEVGHQHRGLSLVSLAAMSLCSINDGLLIGLLQPAWYSGLNLGMVLHKITSSFAVAQMMAGSRYRGAALAALGAVYVVISPAALWAVQLPAAAFLRNSEVPAAFGAGLLAYVTCASLIPHAGGILRRRPRTAFGFIAALAVSISLGAWHQVLHGRGAAPAVPLAHQARP